MKTTLLLLALAFISPAVLGDQRDIDTDPSTDFSTFKTFMVREGQLTAKAPELTGPLTRKNIDASIRTALTTKGLQEVQGEPDLLVNWRFGAANKREVQSWAVGRWGRGRRVAAYKVTEGTLVIDMYERSGRELVWRGVYRDDESNPSKVSARLTTDINKLLKDFPPKKKK